MPPKLIPVFTGTARYRGAYGGRGSGKTASFALMTAIRAYQHAMAGESGIILCGREFLNSLDDSSMGEIKAAIRETEWLAPHFDIGERYIRTKSGKGRVDFSFAGLRTNVDSLKSKSRILLAWIDEAETVTSLSWSKLVPTVRANNSEIWVTWNPEREQSATHQRFRANMDDDMKIVELNWRDNPWFPAVLEAERQRDLKSRPEEYDWVWEGDFRKLVAGAYFAKGLTEAKQQNRIGFVAPDPLMTTRAYWDIGGTGAKADACAIWIAQFIGTEIRVLDHYEAVGQPLATHVEWLRSKGYDKAQMILPHDGAAHDKVYKVTYESALREAGFAVRVIPNMGAGAATKRIEAVRRILPQCRFNETTTQGGREALGWYHEKQDEKRGIGLGPDHDWSSHSADSFGLLAVDYQQQPTSTRQPIQYKRLR
ncbi:phage terminase large subunit [Luteimonas sp. FXH3W]|uniref:Phage terminase large subunit n=1 Tax=Aquilutibacter rugosus TaxID=3115820 RepID=A0ABU7V0U6_9GAMM